MLPSRPAPRIEPLSSDARAIFTRILNHCGLTQHSTRLQVFLAWKSAVGPIIAARTAVHAFGRGVLTIKTAHSAWQQELTYRRDTIVDKMNAILGSRFIDKMRIVSGSLPSSRAAPNTTRLSSPSHLDVAAANNVAAAITDPDLRAIFSRTMAKARVACGDLPPTRQPPH